MPDGMVNWPETPAGCTPAYLCGVKYILYAILIYIVYQFIFKLVIPVYITSRKFKKGFDDIRNQMEEKMRQQQQGYNPDPPPAKKKPEPPKEDYIDFEEVK